VRWWRGRGATGVAGGGYFGWPDAQVRLGHLGRQRDQLEDLAEDGVGAR